MKVIYKKELRGYFNGMMGYVFAAFALIGGAALCLISQF